MSNTTTTTTIPTIENWSDLDQRVFYKGVEVRKANKSTAVPKAGSNPTLYYVNKKGVKGDWYDVANLTVVSKEDKELLKALESQRKDLLKEFMSRNITSDAFIKRESEINETIAKLAQ